MRLHSLLWNEDRIQHIARHGVDPEEVEEVCFDRPLVERTVSHGSNPVYYFLGQSQAGRYLLCVLILFPDGNALPVTARPMTPKEQRRYLRWYKK